MLRLAAMGDKIKRNWCAAAKIKFELSRDDARTVTRRSVSCL
jgi:hypothetical protein